MVCKQLNTSISVSGQWNRRGELSYPVLEGLPVEQKVLKAAANEFGGDGQLGAAYAKGDIADSGIFSGEWDRKFI